ncbi:hypothetical protein [Ruegeria arenilitoris]|uniref:hypothetical protein n=1 Tax=Ruegeria arenilitoris TaxID=1173585 RepID=UPI00147FC494|nr:hypothetical protein [Ruegeria arenilitoris]
MADLESLVRGRDIALVGNASSLFEAFRPIDEHQVVVRINRGVFLPPHRNEAGRRTDLLLVSTDLGKVNYREKSDRIVWMSPSDREKISPSQARGYYFYRERWWKALKAEVGARPSTGCMGVDLLARLGAGRLTLYGFDFWESETFYNGENRPGPHSPETEKKFVLKVVEKIATQSANLTQL